MADFNTWKKIILRTLQYFGWQKLSQEDGFQEDSEYLHLDSEDLHLRSIIYWLSEDQQTVLYYLAIITLWSVSLAFGIWFLWKLIKIPGLIRARNTRIDQKKSDENELRKDVAELKAALLPISQEFRTLPMNDQLSSSIPPLESRIQVTLDRFKTSLNESLELECIRNDQRFGRLQHMMDGFKEGLDEVQEVLKKQQELEKKLPKLPVTNTWIQTEPEMVQKRQGHNKDGSVEERRLTSSLISVIKNALTEFLKEAILHMNLQKNSIMLDLKAIFEQLSEDKDNLKSTIESAISTATHQIQTSIQQFGKAGGDLMKGSDILNENLAGPMVKKFQESSETLQKVVELMNKLSFDLSCVKHTLKDNIEFHLDEISTKLELELVGVKVANHSIEAVKSLQMTKGEWNEKFSQLDETCKQFTVANQGVKDMLVKLYNALVNRPDGDGDTIPSSPINTQQTLSPILPSTHPVDVYSPIGSDSLSPLLSCDESSFLTSNWIPELPAIEEEPGKLLEAVKICEGKLASMKDQIHKNTGQVQQSIEGVSDDLRLLTNLVKSGLETMSKVTFQSSGSEDKHKEEFVGII